MSIEQLRSAGFTDEELSDYKRLSSAGFTDKEIIQHLSSPQAKPSGFSVGEYTDPELTPQEAEGYGRSALETGGMLLGGIGGGAVGTLAAPGPGTFAGTIAGETTGFVGGRKLGDVLYGPRKDSSLAGDVGEGALYSVAPRALGTIGKAALRQIPTTVADKLYRSAAKLETVLKPKTIRKALDTAYKNKITVSTSGQSKLSGFIEGHLSFIDDALARNNGKFVDKAEVIAKIDELIPEFMDMPVAQPYLKALGKMRSQFILEKPDQIPVAQAQRIKRKAWAELHAFFKKAKRLNTTRGTIVGEEFNLKVGSALREGLEKQVPEIIEANKALGGELELQTAIDRAVGRISNKDILSIMDPLMVDAFGRDTWGPGLKAMVARRLLEWPRFKSLLAIEIANAAERPLLKATPGKAAIIPAAKGFLFPESQKP